MNPSFILYLVIYIIILISICIIDRINNLNKFRNKFSIGYLNLNYGILFGLCAYFLYVSIYFCFNFFQPEYVSNYNLDISINYLLIVLLIAPIFEEIFFRSYIIKGSYFSNRSPFLANLFANSIWISAHYYMGIRSLVILFIPGLIFGWLTQKCESSIPAAIAHAVMNLLIVTGAVFSKVHF